MRNTEYPKLVRDRIPEIIAANGKQPIYRVAPARKHSELLARKLIEELEEYLDKPCEEECADIDEVYRAWCNARGQCSEKIHRLTMDKAERNGRFNCMFVLYKIKPRRKRSPVRARSRR